MKGRWESMGSEGNGGTATWSELSNPLSPSPPFWCWDLLVCQWSFHISFFAYPGFTKPILCETIRTSPVAQRLRIHLQCRKPRFNPWVGKTPWRRKWQPTPEFLPGKSHGQRSLVGYSPWGLKRVGHDLVTKQQQFFNIRQHEDIYWKRRT